MLKILKIIRLTIAAILTMIGWGFIFIASLVDQEFYDRWITKISEG